MNLKQAHKKVFRKLLENHHFGNLKLRKEIKRCTSPRSRLVIHRQVQLTAMTHLKKHLRFKNPCLYQQIQWKNRQCWKMIPTKAKTSNLSKFLIARISETNFRGILITILPINLTAWKAKNCENYRNPRLLRKTENRALWLKWLQLRPKKRHKSANWQENAERMYTGRPSLDMFLMISQSLKTLTEATSPTMCFRSCREWDLWQTEKAFVPSLTSQISGINRVRSEIKTSRMVLILASEHSEVKKVHFSCK